jgi:5-methylcytosine-specific restriction enzyme A
MGKPRLKALPPQLPTLAPRLGYAPGDERARSAFRVRTEPWHRWYRTKRWARIRLKVLTDQLWTCQACKRIITEKGQAHVDHVQPHRGNAAAFWAGPFQCLCSQCHHAKSMDEREIC